MPPVVIGWVSAAVLLATIVQQIWRQWHSGSSRGVSPWLFAGQFVASAGMGTYSLATGDIVFVVTNVLMMISAVVGGVVLAIHRRREGRSGHATSQRAVIGG